ncbi:MAG: dTDP-4-dehydrorhamnose reductase [Actinobacteria bacterium]|nr:dTDP-4-dehydrorhamnose reductase [Actinomycetota bacterium]MCL6105484.1 dTDP-4-dehydrorhamnose reductase [Actinomycetota bacterium]
MRVLITGAGGQLGHDLVGVFNIQDGEEVVALKHTDLDVTDRKATLEVFEQMHPDIVVHAAAWTAVDDSEANPDKAFSVNSLGTRHVANAARRTKAHLIYISTDYVFDGVAGRPYVEWDIPNPISVYGRSKFGGEKELDPAFTVVRTSWVCGLHGNNMVRTILKLAKMELAKTRSEKAATTGLRQEPLRFVDDQIGCPTFCYDLALAIKKLAVMRYEGIFHVTNQGETSWFGFAQEVLRLAGYDPFMVVPISTAQLNPPRAAPRPKYSVLDNAALRLAGLGLLPDWHESLEMLVKQGTEVW